MKRILATTILIALSMAALAWLRPSPVNGDISIDAGTNAHRTSTGLPLAACGLPLTAQLLTELLHLAHQRVELRLQ